MKVASNTGPIIALAKISCLSILKTMFSEILIPPVVYRELLGKSGGEWEGALFGSKLGLGNITAIMDYNNLQGYGRARELCSFEPIKSKWEAFGWHVIEINGHDIGAIRQAFSEGTDGKPKMIIAHTTKGKGVSFMEDQLVWHYYIVTDEHKEKALRELKS